MKSIISFSLFCLLISCQNNAPADSTKKETTTSQPNILFLLADDWSFPHAGVYGTEVIKTPTFDRLAAEGAVFTNAYCAAPSCAPSRAAILTSRYPHQLGSGGNLWSILSNKYPNWMSILEGEQYFTGHERKGWAPGDYEKGGYTQNPAGKKYDNFKAFMQAKPADKPFAYWFGSQDPHRPYQPNAGLNKGKDLSEVDVPAFLPDVDCIRNDILDYYFEVERFDEECGEIIKHLEASGLLENTLVIMTSDNGMPFPRAKANLYDFGTRMPLAIYWKGLIRGGIKIEDFVNFVDFGPTILEAAGVSIPNSFHGQTLIPLLKETGELQNRTQVYLERERHANVRKGDQSYPMRAIRTEEYLYIQNFEPDRWPAGDPTVHQSVGQYGDVDNSISKFIILAKLEEKIPINYFNLTFGKRPSIELYDVQKDPYQLNNLASFPAHQSVKNKLKSSLQSWMMDKGDRRARQPNTIYWDTVLYTPNYQFENFDLTEKIKEYSIQHLKSNGQKDNIPCVF